MSHYNPEVVKVRVKPLRSLLEWASHREDGMVLVRAVTKSAFYDKECAAIEKMLEESTVGKMVDE